MMHNNNAEMPCCRDVSTFKRMTKQHVIKLISAILICEASGIIGSLFTARAIPTWYATLNKPSFNLPNWVFAPVWTTLFVMMGVAAFLVWKKGLAHLGVKFALSMFLLQLLFNFLWSVMFFGLRSPLAGLIDIAALWVTLTITIWLFFKRSTVAGLLLLPYLAWVSFASVLNFAIWRLN